MIQELMEAKLITPKEFKVYRLFSSEIGQEVFKEMKEELFWEEPDESMMTDQVLGFYDGRRSILRGIKATMDKVEAIIQKQHLEVEHD